MRSFLKISLLCKLEYNTYMYVRHVLESDI
jgi:hypothetical protein